MSSCPPVGSIAPAPPRIPTVADVLRVASAMHPGGLGAYHWKTLDALMACHTPALGGHVYQCADCGALHFVPHSCRNRHCPSCQGALALDWLARQEADLLPVPYFHVVFTLPHVLNPLIAQNRRALYNLLFASASATLLEFGRRRLHAEIGITAVLHTWSQTLLGHYHLHCVVTGGGLDGDSGSWRGASPNYLFPVRALSRMFRAKFRDGLSRLHAQGALEFHGALAPLAGEPAFRHLVGESQRTEWVVYSKKPFAGPRQVLAYLSRYTHRVAIGNGRILALDPENATVTFAYRDYRQEARPRTMTLGVSEFLRRFCLHILPARFVRIRHYGLLANRDRTARIERARKSIAAGEGAPTPILPAPDPPEPTPRPAMRCPHCGSTHLFAIGHLAHPPPWLPDSP